MQAAARTISWKRLDKPGHESARVSFIKPFWNISGAAVFTNEEKPCRLAYDIRCDAEWQTLSAEIKGWVGEKAMAVEISVDAKRCWWVNKRQSTRVAGCIDLDLNFSPITNTLPIRRLNLAVGQEARVRAAWLKFPSFKLEPLCQVYRRIRTAKYRYESGDGSFVAELDVDKEGLVTHYPNFWRVEDAQ